MKIDEQGYVTRITPTKKAPGSKASYRNWFLIKWDTKGGAAKIDMGVLRLPRKYLGKRVRLKMEVIE